MMAGRPREFDRDAALLKARNAFWKRGYEATSMADLVDALGLASARIYAAFGSKGELFREAIAHYEAAEGGFADRALAEEPTARLAIERMLGEAVALYTRPGQAYGCMVVSAATNLAGESQHLGDWLAQHRRQRTRSIVARLEQAKSAGELQPAADP
jgi:AcrR family transcriptional regulator